MRTVVDWGLADRVAGAMIAGLPGRANEQSTGYTAAEVSRACAGALQTASAYAGLGEVADPPAPELVDRRAWARNALATLADAVAPVEDRLARELDLPGFLGTVAHIGVGGAIGTEA